MNGRTDTAGCFIKVSVSWSHVNIPASCYQMSTLVKPSDQNVRSLSRVGLYDEELQPRGFNGLFVLNSCYLCLQTLLASVATCFLSKRKLERKRYNFLFSGWKRKYIVLKKMQFMLCVASSQVPLQLKSNHVGDICVLQEPQWYQQQTRL